MSDLIIIISTLIACAFFAGMEIAFITSNKLHIELESKQGSIPARIFSYFNNHTPQYLATMLLGNNIALVIFGIFMDDILNPYIEPYIPSHILSILIRTLLSTILILVAAEFIPKNLFSLNPNRALTIFAIPVWIIYCLLYPIVYFTIEVSEFALKYILRVKQIDKKVSFGRVDLDNFVREVNASASEKQEVEHEFKIFQNALDFSNVKARDCMVPRTEIIGLDISESINTLEKTFIQTRLSKLLIFDGSIDNIIGYIHSFELFKKPESIRSILRPVSIIPESMPASEALTVFIQQRKSIAVVVDEFGGTSGILTMEDVMEEIFGEIEDEHDKEDLIEQRINENEFVFSGRLELDYLREKYNLKIAPTDEYKTLSGFIIHQHQSIPLLNERIVIDPYVFKILGVSETRVEQVNMKIKDS